MVTFRAPVLNCLLNYTQYFTTCVHQLVHQVCTNVERHRDTDRQVDSHLVEECDVEGEPKGVLESNLLCQQ